MSKLLPLPVTMSVDAVMAAALDIFSVTEVEDLVNLICGSSSTPPPPLASRFIARTRLEIFSFPA